MWMKPAYGSSRWMAAMPSRSPALVIRGGHHEVRIEYPRLPTMNDATQFATWFSGLS